MATNNAGCVVILRKLKNKDKIGGSHIPEQRALNWVKNLTHSQDREFWKGYKTLINSGWIIRKPKTGEQHIWLNPRKLKEILQFLEQHR